MNLTAEYIKEKAGERQIYIWGAWKRGRKIEEWLTKSGLHIHGYIDKKEKTFYNHTISSPKDILRKGNKVFILVSLVYHESVKKELDSNGFKLNEDYLYMGSSVTITDCLGYQDGMGNTIQGSICNSFVQLALSSSLEIEENVELQKKSNIEIASFSKIKIGKSVKVGNNTKLQCSDEASIVIGNNVIIGNNVKIICTDSSSLVIGNEVKIGDDVIIEIRENSIANFENKVHINQYSFIKALGKGYINAGKGTTFGRYLDLRTGIDTKFICGEDCMISYWVRIRSYNGHHTLIDTKKKEVYKTKQDIVLGNHVWVGTGSTIMQGCQIGNGSVVGANAFVNAHFGENVMIVGSPAKTVREGISWDRRPDVSYEEWKSGFVR